MSKPEIPPHFVKQPRNWLAIAGAVFVIAGLVFIGWSEGAGQSTVATTGPTAVATTTSSSTTKTLPSTSSATTTEASSTTTSGSSGPSEQKTTVVTTSGHQARGSDTLNIFLLGYGALLLLMFVFYERLSKIVLPGGAEIDLTPLSSAKLVDEVHKQLPAASPHEHERALKKAMAALAGNYWGKTASPPEDALRAAAADAARAVTLEDAASSTGSARIS